MILVLDSNVLVWALTEPEAIAATTRSSIADGANTVVVSAASLWELEIKRASGKLRFEVDLLVGLEAALIDILPITGLDAVTSARLPAIHRDPFDRMIVAQAQRLDGVVVTRDRAIAGYDVKVLTA